jgi:hypothetical protein
MDNIDTQILPILEDNTPVMGSYILPTASYQPYVQQCNSAEKNKSELWKQQHRLLFVLLCEWIYLHQVQSHSLFLHTLCFLQ